jgi:hypothetical protein
MTEQQRPSTADRHGAKGNPETEAERDERLQAVENDRAASRKAIEGSFAKRRRGGALGSQGSPQP